MLKLLMSLSLHVFAIASITVIVALAGYLVALCLSKNSRNARVFATLTHFFESAERFDRICYKEFLAKLDRLPACFRAVWDRYEYSNSARPSFAISANDFFCRNRSVAASVATWVGVIGVALAIICSTSLTIDRILITVFLFALMQITIAITEHIVYTIGCKNLNRFLGYADQYLNQTMIKSYAIEETLGLRRVEAEEMISESPKQMTTMDDILQRIDAIKITGGTTQSVEQIIVLLQKEKEREENATPEAQRKINDALADLLKSISLK